MQYSIGFPVITEAGGGIIFRLWEHAYKPGVPVMFEGNPTTFGGLLSGQYNEFDSMLRAQSRTLCVTIGFESAAADGPSPSESLRTDGVTGTSAFLALYFACLHRLPTELPECFAYFVLTGGFKFKSVQPSGIHLEPFRMPEDKLSAKLELLNLNYFQPRQDLILLDHDSPETPLLTKMNDVYLTKLKSRHRLNPRNSLAIDASDISGNLLLLGEKLGAVPIHSRAILLQEPGNAGNIKIDPPPPAPTFGDLLAKAVAPYAELAAVKQALAYITVAGKDEDRILARPLPPFELQLAAYSGPQAEELWTDDSGRPRNLLLSGPTGSGKTALLDALVLRTIIGQEGMAIYLAPTRALATEYHRNFKHRYARLLKAARGWDKEQLDDMIVLSTGEDFSADPEIRAGAVGLACMVTEKANVISAAEQSELFGESSRVRLLIFDELHMLCEPHRGGVVDLLLAKFRHSVQARHNDAPLRLVGVSTESLVQELYQSKAFTSGEPSTRREAALRRPIKIETNRRPISVAHFVQLTARGIELAPSPIFVCAFDSTDKRYLSSADIARVAQECHKKAAEFEREHAAKLVRTGGKELRGVPMTRSIVAEQFTKGCNTVIVAMGSTDSLITVGTQLTQDRPVVPIDKFAIECDRSDLNDTMKRKLKQLAHHNIFLHSADQPRCIREFIEGLFSDFDNDEGKILLTTETLSYGVNLTADCIVLVGTKFPREKRFDDRAGVERIALSANAFHNLLGRAGRYSDRRAARGSVMQPRAIFLTEALSITGPSVSARTETDFAKELERYYGRKDRTRRFGASALFYPRDEQLGQRGDSEIVRFYDNPKSGDPNGFSLLDYSYNAFRTICDTLRYLQAIKNGYEYECNVAGITKFILDWSVYGDLECGHHGKQARNEAQSFEAEGLVALIEAISKRLVENEYVNETGNRLSLTPKAEALIDTGVRPTAIEPIRHYLDLVKHQRCSVPAEFISFAFCATPEFWNIAARDLCQIMHWRKLTDYEMGGEEYLSGSKNIFRRTLSALKFTKEEVEDAVSLLDKLYDLTLGLDENSNRLYAPSAYRVGTTERAQPTLNRIAYFTLCATMIAWVNGVGENELVENFRVRDKDGAPIRESPAMEKRPGSIKVGISDKLGWLTKAAYKYFSDTPRFDHAVKSTLLGLTDRFRSGVSANGLPFLRSVHEDKYSHPVPSRTSIDEFVRGKNSTTLIAECKKPSGLWGRRARAFFENEVASKFTWLDRRPDMQTECKQLIRSLRNIFAGDLGRPLQKIDDAVRASIEQWVERMAAVPDKAKCDDWDEAAAEGEERTQVAVAGRQLIIVVKNDRELSVLLSFSNGDKLYLHFGEVDAIPSSEQGCHLDARQIFLDSCTDPDLMVPRISVFGALVLINFFSRKFLHSHAFEQLRTIPGPISIRDIVIKLANPAELSKVGGTDEALLSFREPGW